MSNAIVLSAASEAREAVIEGRDPKTEAKRVAAYFEDKLDQLINDCVTTIRGTKMEAWRNAQIGV